MHELLLVAAAIFGFAMVSERLAISPVSAPMVYTTVGLVAGPELLGWFDLDLDDEAVSVLVEATLVLVLFTDAVRIDLRALRKEAWLPGRMLAIGLPLTFVAGAFTAAWLFPELSWAEAALLAAVLTPTDAALGQAVVSDRRLPIRLRQAVNVESGLNDGLVLPVVAVALALAAGSHGGEGGPDGPGAVAELIARQIGLGVLCGVAVGAAGGRLLDRRSREGAVEGVYRQLATLAVAASAFAAAELVEGNGFIAAFVAGLAFGHVAREHCANVQDFTEDEGEVLTAITFVVFGAVFAGPALSEVTWTAAAYALLSLTVVRMLPTLVALWRSGTLVETRLFAGWFGPRGLASILFALVVSQELAGAAAEEIVLVASVTVLASVYLHGATANPWTGRLARRLETAPAGQPEMQHAPDLPVRHGLHRRVAARGGAHR